MKEVKCPICGCFFYENLLNFRCEGFDNSKLYENIIIHSCSCCGHIFNYVNDKYIENLKYYYNEEAFPLNDNSPTKTADLPGNKSKDNISRYNNILDFTKYYIKYEDSILDIGCASGGFLDFLNSKNYKHLFGVDIVDSYIKKAKENKKLKIENSDVSYELPFSLKKIDFIFMDQTLEHVANIRNAISEIKKGLKLNGYLCIAVPDASRYLTNYYFDYFWFLIKEHLHHFDLHHLKVLLESEGFELIKSKKENNNIMSDTMILPNLLLLFKYTNNKKYFKHTKNNFNLKKSIRRYINYSTKQLNKRKKEINNLELKGKTIYFWGIGKEFFYLSSKIFNSYSNNKIYMDANSYKQNNLKYKNQIINPLSIIRDANEDSVLFITAIAHTDKILKILEIIKFKGKVITFI